MFGKLSSIISDVIISIGYRVNSEKATRFRVWATQTLRGYIVKGYAIDDERLKHGYHFGKDYFDELLEKIREIRGASDGRFYQKVTDLYAEGNVDYDKDLEITQTFFKTVQNKLHWAITGKTAAELIRIAQAVGSQRWDLPPGRTRRRARSSSRMYRSQRTIFRKKRSPNSIGSLPCIWTTPKTRPRSSDR